MKEPSISRRQPSGGVHRTQLYLDQRQFRLLRELARRRKLSSAALVREALEEYFARTIEPEEDPLFRLGSGDTITGIQDGSDDVDRYLYQRRQEG